MNGQVGFRWDHELLGVLAIRPYVPWRRDNIYTRENNDGTAHCGRRHTQAACDGEERNAFRGSATSHRPSVVLQWACPHDACYSTFEGHLKTVDYVEKITNTCVKRGQPTEPPAIRILACSSSLSGLWSTVSLWATRSSVLSLWSEPYGMSKVNVIYHENP